MRTETPIHGDELLEHVSLDGGVNGSGELQKGTNDKRVLSSGTESDLESRKEQLSFDDCSKQQALSGPGQPFSVSTLERLLSRGKTLPPQGLHARSGEHEVYAMFGRSPGLPGKHLREEVISLEDVAEVSGIPLPDSKRPENEEPTDSYENEGNVVSVKRIKPNTRQKLKQHNSDIDALNPDTREPNAYVHGNADENDKSESQRDASKNEKTRWGPYLRYSSTQNSLPDYRDPEHPSPAAAKSAGARPMKAPFPGGPKPINKLRRETPIVVPSQPKPSQNTTFNLHEGYDRRPPAKKRKTGGDSMGNALSYNEVIDVDGDMTPSQRNRESSTAISGRSHTQNGYSTNSRSIGGGVDEFCRVEHMMNPRAPRKTKNQTNGMSWNRQIPAASKSNHLQKSISTASSVVRPDGLDSDDPYDPISDVDKPMSQPASKTKPQVIISGYKGSANRAPARSKPNVLNVAHSRQFSADDGSRSRYFSSATDDELMRKTGSELGGTLYPSKATTTRQQIRNSDQNASGSAKHQIANEDEIDDLSVAHYATAEHLLHQQRQSKLVPTPGKRKGSSLVRSSSEDEVITLRKSNIKHSVFQNSRKTRTENNSGEKFDVLQIFSDVEVWLSIDSKVQWSLLFDLENITIRSECGKSSLTTTVNAISKVEYSEDEASIFIHKSRDGSFGGATKFCLTLGSRHQAEAFLKRVTSYSLIKISPKSSEYMNKVFIATRKKADSNSRHASEHEIPKDVQLAMQNTQKRLFNNQEKRISSRSSKIVDQMTKNKSGSSEDSLGVVSSRKTRSSSDVIELDEPKRLLKRQRIESGDFYGDSVAENPVNQSRLRSSARLSGRVSPPKQRSPSPERWTASNPGWGDKWKSSIVYPRVGKEKATVDKQDIERLDEGQFLNDNLIEFYIRWLESHLVQENPDLAKRIYFHNTFLYNRLTTNTRGKKGINYEAVERWTSKIDLLSYDYIVVPVNENYHWYVAIICNAPRLLNLESGTKAQSPTLEDGAIEEGSITDTRKENRCSASALASTPPVGDSDEPSILIEEISLLDETDDKCRSKPQADVSSLLTAKESGEDIQPNTSNRENDLEKALSSDPVSGVVDLAAAPLQKEASSKKTKRKSHTAPRKYNPCEPRIITLDSLGLKHSPTCTNLKEYLIAEIKSKHGIDIPQPGSLGMTATSIPEQDNFCDCGLFLLSYIEMFLKQPEKFIHGILQLQDVKELFSPWPRASEMRESMRKLLLDLQAQQVAEELQGQETRKTKRKKGQPLEHEQQANIPITTRIPESHKFDSRVMAETRSAVDTNTPDLVSNHSSRELSIEPDARREWRSISKEFPKTSRREVSRSKSVEQYLRAVSNEPEGEFSTESAGTMDDGQAAPAEKGSRASVNNFVENNVPVKKVPEDHKWKEQALSDGADPYEIHKARPPSVEEILQRSIEIDSRDSKNNETKSRSLDRDADVVEVASSSVRTRKATPYRSRLSFVDGGDQDQTTNFQSFQAKDDNAGGEIDLHKNSKEIEGTDEDEMLLPNGASAQLENGQDYSPSLLSDFKLSSPNVSSHRTAGSSSLAASAGSRKRKEMSGSIHLENSHPPRYLLDSSDQIIADGHANIKA